jgi:hypothetical protein
VGGGGRHAPGDTVTVSRPPCSGGALISRWDCPLTSRFVFPLDTTALTGAQTGAAQQAVVGLIVERAVVGFQNFSSTLFARGALVMLAATGDRLEVRSTSVLGKQWKSYTLTGVTDQTTLRSIDMRTNNSMLYALGSDGQLYTGDIGTALASATATSLALTTVGAPSGPRADGVFVAMDFNPNADAIRIMHGQNNFRVSPNTGNPAGGPAGAPTDDGTANGGQVTPATAQIVAVAYTNARLPSPRNIAGSTTQYVLDSSVGNGVLRVVTNPNAGTLGPEIALTGTPGPITGPCEMDIVTSQNDDGSDRNVAIAIITTGTTPVQNLYTIDLATGAATLVAPIGDSYIGLAFAPFAATSSTFQPLNTVANILADPTQLPYFNGQAQFRVAGGVEGGQLPAPTPDFTTNSGAFNVLFSHLVQFFGASGALGCTGSGFPTYSGVSSMRLVHQNMNITSAIFTRFNQAVLQSALSFGVTPADGDAVAGVLASFGRQLNSPNEICNQADCACAPGADCDSEGGPASTVAVSMIASVVLAVAALCVAKL